MTSAAVVLAAGGSARLGRPKQLEQVAGRSLVRHALAAAGAADHVLLMTGAAAAAVAAEAGTAAVHLVPGWRRGMGHVLSCGIRALAPDVDAVLVLLADQPGVTRAACERLLASWHAGEGRLLTATYGGRPGHPRLFDASLFPLLAELDGDVGARAVLAAHGAVGVAVDGTDADVDDERSLALARQAVG